MAHTWVTGEVITAKKLNALEQTVAGHTTTLEWARQEINSFDPDGDGVVDYSKSCLNVAESVVSPITASEDEFPTVSAGEKVKISYGKFIKWMSDARTHMKTGLLSVGSLFTVGLSSVQRTDTLLTSDDSKEVANTEYVKANLRRYSSTDNGVVDNAVNATTASNATRVGGHTVGVDVPADAEFTDTTDLSEMGGTLDLTTQVTGILPVINGGTGKTTFTANSVLVGNGTSAIGELSIDSAVTAGSNNLITSGAVESYIGQVGGGDMMKSTYDPNDDGIIAIAQGGTGATTVSAARSALGAAASSTLTTTQSWIRDTSSPDTYVDNAKAWKVGEYCIHSNILYKCITACSAGTWTANSSCFEKTTLTRAVTDLNASLTQCNVLDYNNKVNLQTVLNGINKQYTCPKNGYIKLSFVSNGNENKCDFGLTHSGIYERIYMQNQGNGYVPINLQFPVNAGEVLTVEIYISISSIYDGWFIPYVNG